MAEQESTNDETSAPEPSGGGMLAAVERIGNKLPDPTMLFVGLLVIVWILSWLMSYMTFSVIDPRSGEPIVVINQLSGSSITAFLMGMVNNFVTFGPVGTVLVAMLGIGVAEASGFITTGIRALLNVTAKWLLTPMVILVGIVSHTAVDAGYVLVIPLGGIIFYAAGRHPLAGIAAAFAGVSGGFSANFVPSSLDPSAAGSQRRAGAMHASTPNVGAEPAQQLLLYHRLGSLLIIATGLVHHRTRWWSRASAGDRARRRPRGSAAHGADLEPTTSARGLRCGS